jgi:hypothetical protein
MTTDYYSKTTKKGVKETIKELDTPQDKERLKITPLIQEIQDKEQHRRATTSHRQESNSKGARMGLPRRVHSSSKVTMAMGTLC